jgi:superfamily II DNA or RNA helicase
MLRPYQLRAIEMVRARVKDRPLLCLPTGAGKTTVASEIIKRTLERGRRAIFLVHRIELVDQAVARLEQFGLKPGRILAGVKEDRDRAVQVASIPTLLKREHWPADLVLVDECAHAVSASWKKVIDRYSTSTVIGLTATPIRLDGRGLGDLFGCIIEPVTTRELIEAGHLVEPRVFAPPVDLSNLPTRGGDYSIPELAARVSGLTGSIVGEWQKHARGMSTVVFAVNVEHSRAIVAAFQEIGVRAAHVDYRMGREQRRQTLQDLRHGVLDMVSQVSLLSEGWDLPTLQCAVLARPTQSLALFRQMVGRVMRPPGPVLVLDHAGNHHAHGLVTEPIEWSLDGAVRNKRTAPSVATCKNCFACFAPGPLECPVCGHPLRQESDAEAPAVHNPGELVELSMSPPKATMDEKESTYARMVQACSDEGEALGTARGRFKRRFGVWPRFSEIERTLYKCSGHVWETVTTHAFDYVRCARCYQRGNERDLVAQRAKSRIVR